VVSQILLPRGNEAREWMRRRQQAEGSRWGTKQTDQPKERHSIFSLVPHRPACCVSSSLFCFISFSPSRMPGSCLHLCVPCAFLCVWKRLLVAPLALSLTFFLLGLVVCAPVCIRNRPGSARSWRKEDSGTSPPRSTSLSSWSERE